jgi:Icc-related predicted phosphoesterase
MIIDCISDLHGFKPKLKRGDLLIIAGDLTAQDRAEEYEEFALWLSKQKYTHKIVVAGNHDGYLEREGGLGIQSLERLGGFRYLQDSFVEIEGLKIYGSPWTKRFFGINPLCCAFTVDEGESLKARWDQIPEDTDILVTHCPPFSVLDNCIYGDTGDKDLVARVVCVRPKLQVFGHIHEGGGKRVAERCSKGRVVEYVNAAYVNRAYEPVHKPVRIVL